MEIYDKFKERKEKIKEESQKKIARKILYNLDDVSNENLVRLASLMQIIAPSDERYKAAVAKVKTLIQQGHPSVDLIRKILKEIEPKYREKLVENLIINGLILNQRKRKKLKDEGFVVPMSVLISPTMRCNLNCVGCYAGKYNKKDDMSFEVFDRIITEAEELGIAFFTILGGEPLILKDNLFKICKKHNKSFFQFYTNGTLIDETVVKELKKLGNIIPIISLEGYEKETDERRGKGTYAKVMDVMDLLKKNKIPFGFSAVISRKNAEIISDEKFIDFMIKKGAFIGWFFLYMPIGNNPDLKLMPTPKQRRALKDRWDYIRKTKPIFIIDFWNDAPYVGGCIAGKFYIHITSKGDVEPCIFTHFAVDNIKNKSLKEVMLSDFFKELRKRQPFNENLYLPCMWIDNPSVSRDIFSKFKCYPTHEGADIILKDEKIKKGLDKYSKEVKKEYASLGKDKNNKK
jgi:MoaA/NifB/PqqE/SkfB family radical SAM enzyme